MLRDSLRPVAPRLSTLLVTGRKAVEGRGQKAPPPHLSYIGETQVPRNFPPHPSPPQQQTKAKNTLMLNSIVQSERLWWW